MFLDEVLFRQLGVVRENPLERFRVIVVHGEKRFRQVYHEGHAGRMVRGYQL